LKVNKHMPFELRDYAEQVLEKRESAIRHNENLRVAKFSAFIAVVAALAAIASAWYAKSQANSAALSAQASQSSTVQPPAIPIKP
jgi:hypothetical protein